MNGGRLMIAGDDEACAFVLRQVGGDGGEKFCSAGIGGRGGAPAERGGKRAGEAFHFTGAQGQAMIGLGSRGRGRALDHVETTHVGVGIALGGEIADVAHVARESRGHEIRVERDDGCGLGKIVAGFNGLTEDKLRAFEHVVAIHRLVDMPLRLGIHGEEGLHLVFESRRRDGLREDANARALQGFLHDEWTAELFGKLGPRRHVTEVCDALGAVGIVHGKDGGLREKVGGAEAGGMQRITFNFCGTAEVTFDKKRLRVSAEREGGGVEHRPAGNDLLGLANVGDDLFERKPRAAGHSGHGERSAHELEEAAAGDGVEPLGRALGEFAVHHLAEFGGAGEFFEAAPIFRAAGAA